MDELERKTADTPSSKMKVAAASVSDFPKEKSCFYPNTKGGIFTVFFSLSLKKKG